MKKLITILASISLFAAAVEAGSYVPLVNGPAYTTNTVLVGTTNYQNGVVLGAWTNSYNLATGFGTQSNTNLWPSAGFAPQGNYPGTLYGPYNNLMIAATVNLVATNASSTALVFRYAGSVDGSHWTSNYFVQTYTVPINVTTAGQTLTNITTGGLPYMALQSIENPGAAVATNIIVQVTGKPGL